MYYSFSIVESCGVKSLMQAGCKLLTRYGMTSLLECLSVLHALKYIGLIMSANMPLNSFLYIADQAETHPQFYQ